MTWLALLAIIAIFVTSFIKTHRRYAWEGKIVYYNSHEFIGDLSKVFLLKVSLCLCGYLGLYLVGSTIALNTIFGAILVIDVFGIAFDLLINS